MSSFRDGAQAPDPESRDSGFDASHRPGMTKSSIQRLVLPENSVLVERDPPVAGEIGLDVRPRRDAVVQADQSGNLALKRFHAFWKGVAQPLHDLEQRQIDIGEPPARDIAAAIGAQQLFEIPEI